MSNAFNELLKQVGSTNLPPVEKLSIEVEDVPFLAVDMEASGEGEKQQVLFKTNMDEVVRLDDAHPLTIANTDTGPRPYIAVRDGLRARVLSDVFYRLADFVENPEADPMYLRSAGSRFQVS